MTNNFPNCPVPVWQDQKEFAQLITEVKKIKPSRILEIGSLNGGTLWHWINVMRPIKLCSVDLMVPDSDWRSPDQVKGHAYLWKEWAKQVGTQLMILNGHSGDELIVDSVKAFSKEYDFVFIDGGHSYDEVKSDFETYLPMVRSGGIIAFHGINEAECPDVIKYWDEIKTTWKHVEIKELKNKWGIGVIYVD